MAKEFIWGGKLDMDQKTVVFNPSSILEEDLDNPLAHSLLVKRITLGPLKVPSEELNVVEVEADTINGIEKIQLCCLQASAKKFFDSCGIDILLTGEEIKFHLVQGSGPISILAQHLVEPGFDDSIDLEDYEKEEEDEEKNEPNIPQVSKMEMKIGELEDKPEVEEFHAKPMKKSSNKKKINVDAESDDESEPRKKTLKKTHSKQAARPEPVEDTLDDESLKKPVKKTAKQKKTAASTIKKEKEEMVFDNIEETQDGDDEDATMKKTGSKKETRGGRKAKKN